MVWVVCVVGCDVAIVTVTMSRYCGKRWAWRCGEV